MATFSEKLAARLLAYGGVTAIAGDRVQPFAGEYGEDLPALYFDVGPHDPDEFNGLPAIWSGTQKVTISLHCVAMSLAQAERLRDEAENALNGWFDTATQVEIHGAVPSGGGDPHGFEGGGTSRVIYRCVREFSVHTHRTLPS